MKRTDEDKQRKSTALKEYWANLSSEERIERTKHISIANSNRRGIKKGPRTQEVKDKISKANKEVFSDPIKRQELLRRQKKATEASLKGVKDRREKRLAKYPELAAIDSEYVDGGWVLRELLRRFKNGARYRGYSWELTDIEAAMLFKQSCFYCGQIPHITKASIDRLDSKEGYTTKNVVPSCSICNMMKQDYSKEEFLKQIKLIYQNRLW